MKIFLNRAIRTGLEAVLRRLSVWALIIFCGTSWLYGQDSVVVMQGKFYTIKEDSTISDLLDKYREYNRKKEFTDGYRIQIIYTDIRDEVYKSKGKTYKEFPELTSYVEYEQPYYKLRLGDFKTRLEATYYLQEVTPLYSGAFIVRDKIRIK